MASEAVLGASSFASLVARVSEAAPPSSFVPVERALFLLGVATLVGGSLASAVAGLPDRESRVCALVALALGVLAAWQISPLLWLDGWALTLAVVMGLPGLWWLARRIPLGRPIRWLERFLPQGSPAAPFLAAGRLRSEWIPMAAVLLFLAGVLYPGALVAAALLWMAWVYPLRSNAGQARGALALWSFSAILIPVYALAASIAGGVLPRWSEFIGAPFSPPAEIWLASLGLAAIWAWLGLWPLHRLAPGSILAPMGGMALWGVGRLWAGGLEHWEPILALAAALSAWWGVAVSRPAMLAGATGVLGMLDPAGRVGAEMILVCGALLDLGQLIPRLRIPAHRWTTRLLWMIPIWAATVGLGSALAHQVAATVAVTAAAAAALMPRREER